MLDPDRPRRLAAAPTDFADDTALTSSPDVLRLFHQAAAAVPVYGAFLAGHCVDPDGMRTLEAFRELPLTDKESYLHLANTQGQLAGGAASVAQPSEIPCDLRWSPAYAGLRCLPREDTWGSGA